MPPMMNEAGTMKEALHGKVQVMYKVTKED
jgi:hypothetical protein